MSKSVLIGGVGLAFALGMAAPASAADVIGVWLSQSRSAHVEITKCGDHVCGRILSATPAQSNPLLLDIHNKDPNLRTRRMIGQIMIEDFSGGPPKWTGGRLYNPGDGNFYHGALTLVDDNHLQVKGCAFWFLCKSQTWTRIQ